MKKQNELFQSSLVRGKPGSGRLFDEELSAGSTKSGPVTCLGMTYENDDGRSYDHHHRKREAIG